MQTLEEYKKDFLDNIRADASLVSRTASEFFLEKMTLMLEDMGYLFDTNLKFFQKRGRNNRIMQLDGYCYDDTDKSIVLIYSDFHDDDNPENLSLSKIDTIYSKMIYFLEEAYNDKIKEYCDDSEEYIKIARQMKYRLNLEHATADLDETIEKIKLFILSNSKLSNNVKNITKDPFLGRKVEVEIWSIERFYEIALSGEDKEIITINMEDFGIEGLDCLKANISGTEDYEAYLAIVPGKVLSDIYYKYGSRLLEGNVRAFLTAKGKVNKGIRKTIIKEPTKFFTYNNGIATTAKEITIIKKGSSNLITSITDLQIINGGQTTASLTSAFVKKESELNDIFIPMKLTVVKNDEYEEMVQNISKYANSQNKVTDADLFSNHPFHVAFENLAKRIPAPPKDGNVFQTMWYYERSRGKYEQEQFRFRNGSKEKEDFKRKYPKNQVIKKEELSKYINSIMLKPHIVSKGSAKCMNEFATYIDKKWNEDETHSYMNERFFKKAICSAIIFRETDKIIYKSPWYPVGGYKLNIIPYTISKLVYEIDKIGYSLNYNLIWKNQTMFPSLVREIEKLTKIVNDFIMDSNGIIVTEYCKKQETWEKLKKLTYHLSNELINDLIYKDFEKSLTESAKKTEKKLAAIDLVSNLFTYTIEDWKNIAEKAVKGGVYLSSYDISCLKHACEGKINNNDEYEELRKILIKIEKKGIII